MEVYLVKKRCMRMSHSKTNARDVKSCSRIKPQTIVKNHDVIK